MSKSRGSSGTFSIASDAPLEGGRDEMGHSGRVADETKPVPAPPPTMQLLSLPAVKARATRSRRAHPAREPRSVAQQARRRADLVSKMTLDGLARTGAGFGAITMPLPHAGHQVVTTQYSDLAAQLTAFDRSEVGVMTRLQQFSRNKKARELDISACTITAEVALVAHEVIAHHPSLRHLDVSDCCFKAPDHTVPLLVAAMDKSRTLQSINARNTTLSTERAIQLLCHVEQVACRNSARDAHTLQLRTQRTARRTARSLAHALMATEDEETAKRTYAVAEEKYERAVIGRSLADSFNKLSLSIRSEAIRQLHTKYMRLLEVNEGKARQVVGHVYYGSLPALAVVMETLNRTAIADEHLRSCHDMHGEWCALTDLVRAFSE